MKKILFLAALLLAATGLKAQEESERLWSLKPMAGATYSSATGSGSSMIDYKFGFTGGAEALYRPQGQEVVSVSAGLLYTMQGYKIAGNPDITMKLNYLNLPVLMNFRLTESLTLKLGLQLGYLLTATASGGRNGIEVDLDVWDAHQPWYLSAPVGVSFTTPFGIVADLRYCFGLTDIEKDEFTLLGQNIKNDGSGRHHSVFMLTLGYQFDL